ncbi:MAG: L-asparaginase / beta-aspartyl-peptidase [Thermoplasmata archaeon]|jgi:isoaspartyl peptidase/L-asparaginase-like protein (Ntn-hydrolase superfamily)|nr:L-asparaginase / beta-aspartyl-peptidase [Thermoplasmata archaeon]
MPGRLDATFLAHGGATAGKDAADGTQRACAAGQRAFQEGASLLDAAVLACRVLEDDGRFNAGRGSQLRLDGKTVEMDAACMTSDGQFGAVICVADVRNPILAARAVHDTPHNALVGDGATAFARSLGLAGREAPSEAAVRHALAARKALQEHGHAQETGWRLDKILEHWNYQEPPPQELLGSDTVGVVATDGRAFVAAASTGGLSITLRGRASDVGMLGAGIYAGRHGAVACTGRGEFLARSLFSHRVYQGLADGLDAGAAIERAMRVVPDKTAVGAIAVGTGSAAGADNCRMPWSRAG